MPTPTSPVTPFLPDAPTTMRRSHGPVLGARLRARCRIGKLPHTSASAEGVIRAFQWLPCRHYRATHGKHHLEAQYESKARQIA